MRSSSRLWRAWITSSSSRGTSFTCPTASDCRRSWNGRSRRRPEAASCGLRAEDEEPRYPRNDAGARRWPGTGGGTNHRGTEGTEKKGREAGGDGGTSTTEITEDTEG